MEDAENPMSISKEIWECRKPCILIRLTPVSLQPRSISRNKYDFVT